MNLTAPLPAQGVGPCLVQASKARVRAPQPSSKRPPKHPHTERHLMLNQSARADVAHLQVLSAAAQEYERWHNEQVEAIHKRLIRRRFGEDKLGEVAAITLAVPPVFDHYRAIDAALRATTPVAHEDRKYLAEVRCWLHDAMEDLCAFELDAAVSGLEGSVKKIDWILHGRSRAGSRRYRLLDDESAARLTTVLGQVDALLSDVVRVRALVAA